METSAINSALSEVRQRLKESGCPYHATHGTPVIWAPIFQTPVGISAQVCLPVAVTPHLGWSPNCRHLTPNCGPQSASLPQTPMQPTSSYIQTGASPYILQNTPQPEWMSPLWANNNPPINQDFGGPHLLHTQNQPPPNQLPQQHNDNFKPGSQTPSFPNALGLQQMDNLLSAGCLKWDIRQHPTAARFGFSHSSVPNLDTPALPLGVEWAEINFGNNRMKLFADTWGPIQVRVRSDLHSGVSNPISIQDILNEIYRYFMQPLDEQERTRLVSTPRQKEEVSAAFRARGEVQGWNYDFYRRADLLPRLSNFSQVVLVGRGFNSSSLTLRLY